jgi:O-antigen ligase
MNFIYSKLTSNLAIFFVLVSVFCIQLPTKYLDISLSILFLFWAISGNYTYKFHKIFSNPGAIVSLLLFLVIGLCTLFSTELTHESFRAWFRYHGLLFIPVIISLIDENKFRDYAINTFLVSSCIVLLISYLKWFGIVPMDFIRTDNSGPVAFRHSISQSIFLAYAIYLMAVKLKQSEGYTKYIWMLAIAFSIFNIFFMVDSRSGQLAMLFSLSLLICINWKPQHFKYLLSGSFLLFVILLFQFNSISNLKIFNIKNEILLAQNQNQVTSSGQRLELWSNTLALVKKHPFFGGGAGSLEYEYRKYTPEDRIVVAKKFGNPHSHYVLTLQETGIVGLGLFFLFWLTHWKVASKLAYQPYEVALKGLIVIFIVTSFFNCMFWGGEGKFYYLMAGLLLSAYNNKHKNVRDNS